MLVHESNHILTTKQILTWTLLSQETGSPRYHLSGFLENIFHRVMTQFVKVALYLFMKRTVQENIKRTSVKNLIFMSAKTVPNNITPLVKRKGNILYDIFAMKVAFSSLYFAFGVFLLIFYLV